jgi:hypothetical protein
LELELEWEWEWKWEWEWEEEDNWYSLDQVPTTSHLVKTGYGISSSTVCFWSYLSMMRNRGVREDSKVFGGLTSSVKR